MAPPHAPWFRAAIAGELLLELPFFLFAAATFARRRNAVRLPAVAYAGYALASTLPYVAEIAAHRARWYDPRPLLRMNAPWVAAPALLAIAMAALPRPFGPAGGSPEPCAPAAWARYNSRIRAALDRLFLAFFLSHIPITVFVDAQAVLPPARFPAAARAASAWYLRAYKDPLMAPPIAPWFAALCWSELLLQARALDCLVCASHFALSARILAARRLPPDSHFHSHSQPPHFHPPHFQLPFFFAAAYAFLRRRAWVRLPAVFYGSFVLGTMAPILAELAAHRGRGYRRAAVLAMYAPYAIVPFLLVATMMAAGPAPFGPARAGGARAKRA
jgi:hypothetical protein